MKEDAIAWLRAEALRLQNHGDASFQLNDKKIMTTAVEHEPSMVPGLPVGLFAGLRVAELKAILKPSPPGPRLPQLPIYTAIAAGSIIHPDQGFITPISQLDSGEYRPISIE